MFFRFHTRDGREDRHGGLADRHHVEVGTEGLEHRDAVVDIVIEVEPPSRERDLLGVGPISDEHLMAVEEGGDRSRSSVA